MRSPVRFLIGILLLGLCMPCLAETGTVRPKVRKYFQALKEGRLDQAFRAFGVPAKLSESRWAILNEYQIKDPGPMGRCEGNLETIGEALKKFNTAYVRYPKTLKEITPKYLKVGLVCPEAKGKPYRYDRRDDHYFVVSCPNGHGKTPGFPMYSSVDGLLGNPKAQMIPYFFVLDEQQEDGLTKVRVVGATARGPLDTVFSFTPSGDLETSVLTRKLEGMLRQMAEKKAPRVTDLDTPTFLLGMALMSDDELVRAAHCRLSQDRLYYRIQGARRRLGEISYAEVGKHIGKLPTCPSSRKTYIVEALSGGRTKIYCPGSVHSLAGLGANEPSRTFK